MGTSKTLLLTACAAAALFLGDTIGDAKAVTGMRAEQGQSAEQNGHKQADQAGNPVLPRGKKLVLKDGSFQLVREYDRNGERVRYFSAERGDWEELPAAMVDWEATKKAEAAEHAEEEALAEKVHSREQAQKVETFLDIDASLQVAPGVFLPPGEGMFVIAGKSVTPLEQVGAQIKTDKKQFLKQVLTPIPIVPGKQNVEVPGARAKIRVPYGLTEFYLREAPPDPDRTTPIVKSSRPGESGPEVELIRATVKGNKRVLESIRSLFGQQMDEKQALVSIQRWEIAPTVFRFTLSESLPQGEYALAEILPDGMNFYVWDFGVDGPATPSASKK
jgi:hypothetical protein